ncbi:MAG: ArgE/DapE family deacylase [Gemmatimonadetes bacterium]|nr:ArgE/DapE family deacylase [Gemmatimonadota bacterium]MBK7715609.1 ArgE/DapE family deacylase [Gemmatimonadota bacterium]MBK7925580.1 ArgE/DapE family deacylase [Gemmatimonadota bacterium]MBK9691157.1 ArgE/DapE family deacylase [Gemmatimonadota bacterium]
MSGTSPSQRVASIHQAVEAARDRILALHQSYVRVRSVTGTEGAMGERVATTFRERGLATESWAATAEEMLPYLEHVGEQPGYAGRNNVVGRRAGAGGGRSILLNAHIDTVPEGDHSLWTQPPFAAHLVNGRVYGRGSCDMKGGLTTHLAALDALEACGLRLQGDVTIAATVGEEDGGIGALATVLRGYRADAALVTEPTQLALVTACEGSLVFRLTITGRSAHAATRDEGVSALEKFIPIFQDLQRLEQERNLTLRHPLYDVFPNKVPINVGVVRAGNWASTVPEILEAEIRVGFLPGEELEAFKGLVAERIMRVAAMDPWLREHPPVITYFGGQFIAAETPAHAPLAGAIRAAHRAVTGREAPVEAATYGADMRHFVAFGGMPCVMYGAGDIRVAHAPDEYLEFEELITAIKVVAVFLADWCGVA